MWLECIGVVSRFCCKEIYIYINFLILLICTPLVLALFCSSIPRFPTSIVHFKKCFFVLVYVFLCNIANVVQRILCKNVQKSRSR